MVNLRESLRLNPAPRLPLRPVGQPVLLGLNVLGLAAVALFFRLWRLDHIPGVNGDEAWYGIQALALLHGESIAWTTPTNNPINWLYFGPVVLLHAVFEPSFGLLRVAAVGSGLAALLLNFVLCRRLYGFHPAVISTLMLAVLPINVSSSRFGWDTCQTLLVTLLVVYPILFALRGRRPNRAMLLACLAMMASLYVHPTSIFLLPLLVIAAGRIWGPGMLRAVRQGRDWRVWLPISAVLLTAAVVVGLKGQQWLARMADQIGRLDEAAAFSLHCLRVFTGVTTYQFIPGSIPEGMALNVIDLIALPVAAAATIALTAALFTKDRGPERTLLLGFLAGVAAFFLVGGMPVTDPDYQRYSLWLIAPSALLCTLAAAWMAGRFRRPAQWGLVALGWLMLSAFHLHYFDSFQSSGGAGHRSFRTAAVEPKQAAWEFIQKTRIADPSHGPLYVIASESWLRRPLHYLAAGDPQTIVAGWWAVSEDGFLQALRQGRVCFVEFSGGAGHEQVRRLCERHNVTASETVLRDYRGRDTVTVVNGREAAALGSGPSVRKT